MIEAIENWCNSKTETVNSGCGNATYIAALSERAGLDDGCFAGVDEAICKANGCGLNHCLVLCM